VKNGRLKEKFEKIREKEQLIEKAREEKADRDQVFYERLRGACREFVEFCMKELTRRAEFFLYKHENSGFQYLDLKNFGYDPSVQRERRFGVTSDHFGFRFSTLFRRGFLDRESGKIDSSAFDDAEILISPFAEVADVFLKAGYRIEDISDIKKSPGIFLKRSFV
jgi:hypothetical protein